MTREEIKTFTLRVTEANSCDLIVILYDVILSDLKDARLAYKESNLSEYAKNLHHATRFMNELIANLNFSVELSHNLMSLYSYCNMRISYAVAGNHVDALDIVEDVIKKLRDGFKQLADKEAGGPMMKNVQSVYAGLTYGKGCLNETYVDVKDYNRGFRA